MVQRDCEAMDMTLQDAISRTLDREVEQIYNGAAITCINK